MGELADRMEAAAINAARRAHKELLEGKRGWFKRREVWLTVFGLALSSAVALYQQGL